MTLKIAIKLIIICFICLNMWVNIVVLAVKSGPQIATKTGNPANLVFRRKIWGARDNGIPPRSTPAYHNFVVKNGILYIVKLLKCVCFFATGAVPIHDVATREKRLLGSELAFVHVYLILDRVPKYSISQLLHLYNPFKLDAVISRNWLVS